MKIKLSQWAEKKKMTYLAAWRLYNRGGIPNASIDETNRIWVDHENIILYSCGNDDLFKLKDQIEHDSFWSDSGDRSALGLALAEPNMGTFIIKGLNKLEESEKNLMFSLLKAKNVEIIEVKTVK